MENIQKQITALAEKAGLLEHTPGLTVEAAAIVLGVRGAKARALRCWRKSALEVEIERVREVLNQNQSSQ